MFSQCFLWSMILTLLCQPLFAQENSDKQTLFEELKPLQKLVESLDRKNRADVEVCAKAVEWILRHDEFYRPNYVQSAEQTLQLGIERAAKLASGNVDWGKEPGKHALGYRSKVDDSVQPYILTLPNGYTSQGSQRWPLYVVLHGRNGNLTEAHFIASQNGKPASAEQSWIQLDVFGRTNNAYRWAGETDVFEAMQDVMRRCKIDEQRITLWGFSMGGAGAWHLGLHHPSRWASVGAGAGFVDFYEYQKQTQQLPDFQHRPLRIYDAKDYALNLSTVPFITYGGEKDAQLQASLTVQKEAQRLDVPLQLIVGPNMGHKFDDVSKAKFMKFLGEHNQQGRKRSPGLREIQFITYTLKYNQCEWLTIHEQAEPYEETTVTSKLADDGTLVLETKNVTALSAVRSAANKIMIDGDGPFELVSAADENLIDVYYVKDSSGWELLDYDDSLDFEANPDGNKRHNLQGPIDDAFMQPFVCVQGTGSPWSSTLGDYANWSAQRFGDEFDKWMRAKPLFVDDEDLSDEMIRDRNLVLFGDPGSNSVLRKVVDQLPLTWTEKEIEFGGQRYSTANHAVVLIFPNPLNPRRYVVLNTGMTPHEADFKNSNSWLFPKLGDHAVIQFQRNAEGGIDETTVSAGIFDAHWSH